MSTHITKEERAKLLKGLDQITQKLVEAVERIKELENENKDLRRMVYGTTNTSYTYPYEICRN